MGQEVKQEQGQDDSIVNILENMKTEQETAQSISSAMPLDYTVSVSNTSPDTPLNLVNNMAKRIKNVYVVQGQNGQQIIQEVPVSNFDNSYPGDQKVSPHSLTQDPLSGNILCLDPPSPNDD